MLPVQTINEYGRENAMRNTFAALCVVAMVAALFIGGAQPVAVGSVSAPWDKLAHALFFFVFVMLLRLSFTVPLWLMAGAAVVVGAVDELHQLFLPGRTPGLDDWLADVVGVVLAVMIIRLVSPSLTTELT